MIRQINSSSFRDPDGFVFRYKNSLYRQINFSYRENYDYLIKSGLYDELQKAKLLIEHKEINDLVKNFPDAYKIIKPKLVPFITYPYEWCFSQLKDAALTMIKIQKIALIHGMSLKDASAYNIQFVSGKPMLIDTLSFERYIEGEPWKPYRQFCQHFLGPLVLARYKDVRLLQLARFYIDGIPVDLIANILPSFAYLLSPSLFFHIHLHARAQRLVDSGKIKIVTKNKQSFSTNKQGFSAKKFGKNALYQLLESLEGIVSSLNLKKERSQWLNYYGGESYSFQAFKHKVKSLKAFIDYVQPKNVWDLGSNTGFFSRIASSMGIETISFDNDYALVEENYIKMKTEGDSFLLPLILDLSNPSPAGGFANNERLSIIERGPADMVLALALVHHLVIANNIPFSMFSEFLNKITKWSVIEFIPKSDKRVKKMLQLRKDIFKDYDENNFEREFVKFFKIEKKLRLRDSLRVLYLMRKK